MSGSKLQRRNQDKVCDNHLTDCFPAVDPNNSTWLPRSWHLPLSQVKFSAVVRLALLWAVCAVKFVCVCSVAPKFEINWAVIRMRFDLPPHAQAEWTDGAPQHSQL